MQIKALTVKGKVSTPPWRAKSSTLEAHGRGLFFEMYKTRVKQTIFVYYFYFEYTDEYSHYLILNFDQVTCLL